MVVINKTRKTILTKDLKIANSPADMLLGLIKKTNPRSMLFKTRFGIHTYLLKEKIDVLVLDSENFVAKTQTVNPNSLFFYKPLFSTVIELPKGSIRKSQTEVGDLITFSS